MREGVGIDLLDIARLERALQRRPGLRDRLFTVDEQDASVASAWPVRHLAARFCAKEAVTKALRMDAFRPLEIEVVGRGGPPTVRLTGAAAARAAELGVSVVISMTHEREVASAVAWATAVGPEGAR
jgi:holo-[acyl-carrier protein] synthase